MSVPAPVPAEPTSALSKSLRNLAAVLIAALALTTLARSIVRVVDETRVRFRRLWASDDPGSRGT